MPDLPEPRVDDVDEIKNFVDARFICPHESAWRIFNFDIHARSPPVQVRRCLRLLSFSCPAFSSYVASL
jgi:hypothetical protein